MDILTLIMRTIGIVFGIALLILSFLIYKRTRDATKGWFYLSMFGITLFLWSATAAVFKAIDIFWIRASSAIIFLILMGYFIISAYTKLVEDLWIEKPDWVTQKNLTCAIITLFLIILIYNTLAFWQDFASPVVKYLSITQLWLGLIFFIAAIPTYFLMKTSKNIKWAIAFWACIIVGLSLNFGTYYDNCCGEFGLGQELEVCQGYDLDYIRAYETMCVPSIVGVGKYYQLGGVLSIVLITIQFFLILRDLKKEK